MPDSENGRYHVLVHEPPAGLGGTGFADGTDDRGEAVGRARDVAREIRADFAPDDDHSFAVVVDDQLTGETVFSTDDEPPSATTGA